MSAPVYDGPIRPAADFHRERASYHRAIAGALDDGTYAILLSYDRYWVPTWWLADKAKISQQAANNRLATLWHRGICERRARKVFGGGRRYEYRWKAKIC